MIAAIALLTFLSAILLVNGLRARAVDPIEVRLAAIRAGKRPAIDPLDRPFIERAVAPAFSGLGGLMMRVLPPGWVKSSEERLVWAGRPTTIQGFLAIWVAMAVVFAFLFYVVAGSFGFAKPIVALIALGGVGFGSLLPQMWLRARIAERVFRARRALPDVLDLMTTSVEAGLSLDASLMKVAEAQRGPVQDEIAVALQDMTLGKPRRDALTDAAKRLNVPEFTTFVQTLNQAEITGAPIGQVLRVQAEQVRIRRRQLAEAQAQRAPLLMIIPLVFFIFPSLFMVLIGPAAMSILDAFKSMALSR